MEEEIWKDIKGFEGLYQVSNFGRIKSLYRLIEIHRKDRKKYTIQIKEKIIKPRKGKDGYWDISLWKNNKQKFYSVHRLVAETFIDNPLNKETVNHIDGNKDNNCLSNLEWATYKEQVMHAKENNLLNSSDLHIKKSTEIINEYNNNKYITYIFVEETGENLGTVKEAADKMNCSKEIIYKKSREHKIINNIHLIRKRRYLNECVC